MKFFQAIRNPLNILGLNQPVASQTKFLNWRNVLVLVGLGQLSTICGLFIMLEATTLKEYADCFYISVTAFLNFFIIVIFVQNTANLFELINGFESVTKKRMENADSATLYANVNKTVDKLTNTFHLVVMKLSLPCLLMPSLTKTCFLYITTDLTDAFTLPFPAWQPFDWRTPFGFFISYSSQCASCYCIAEVLTCHLSLLIGSCKILMAVAEDLKREFYSVNEANRNKENRTELSEKLSEFVQFHTNAMDLASKLTNIYELIITVIFLWAISTICSTLLMIQAELSRESVNPMDLIQPVLVNVWSFAAISLYCDFGENVLSGFDEIKNAICESDWHSFPHEMQKILPIVMRAAQKHIKITGFGNISFTRETFKGVVNKGFSYFMFLREFDN